MLPIPLLKLGRHFLDKRGGIKELAVLSYPIDNSDGTSTTVPYVNSLAILFDDGQLNITGYNRFGECRTGDLDTINYPNEAAWNVDHVWRADRAFVIRTFDNQFFYIGCTAGLIGSDAAGGNDVCVREWTPLPEQIVRGLHLDTHPERLIEVMGGINNTVWVIAEAEGTGILNLYGSGNNTYGSLHVDKNQHATPVKIGETSENPETGPWKNPSINCEVHDNSVIFGGPRGFWIAGYDFLRNNSRNDLVWPPVQITRNDLRGIPADEEWKGFMCGPNGAIIATQRMHTPNDQQLVNVFYGQNVWGDDTWRSLNITYTHEVIMARGYGTSGIFFNNGTKQYRGFSRNLCNDIGAQSANNSPRANFIHYQALATAKYVEQRLPVSWTESVYFQGIHREGFLGTFTVVNGKLWWSGIPRGSFAGSGSNNLFGGRLNSQGFTEVPENWYKNVPVDSWGVEDIFDVNGISSVSNIYIGDTVKMKLKPQPEGATFIIDKIELVNAAGTVVTDANYQFSTNWNHGGANEVIVTQYNRNVNRRGLYSVKITYHDKHGTGRTHTTRNLNWNTIVPAYPSDGKWHTVGRNKQFHVNDTVYFGLNAAQPAVEGDTSYMVRLHRMDAGSVTYDVTQEIYNQRRNTYDNLVQTQALWEFNPNGRGGKMLQVNEQNGTSLTVHEHPNPWPDPGKPNSGARTLKIVSHDVGYFGIRWEATVRYADGTTNNIGITLGGTSEDNSLKIAYTPRGISIDNMDVVRNGYGDVNIKVTLGEHLGGERIIMYAFDHDPRTNGTYADQAWSYLISAPEPNTKEFYYGMKRDVCKKTGTHDWIAICVKDERTAWDEPVNRWFVGIPTRSDKYVEEYIVCMGGTNLNLCWNEDANNKYSDYDYMRDYSCNQWFNQPGYADRQARVNPAIFTDTHVFLTKQANEVQTFKNNYDPNKWFYNCSGAIFWGPAELPDTGSCLGAATYGSDYIMGQVKKYEIIPGPAVLGNAVDPYINFAAIHANMDGGRYPFVVPLNWGYKRVVMIIKCDLIGKQVLAENGTSTHLFETALHYQFADSPYAGDKRISDTDSKRCKKVLLGAGWWWYEFDLTDKFTDDTKTLTGIRLDLGENMHKSVCDGTYGDPTVYLKYVSLEHREEDVYGPKLRLFGSWIAKDRVGMGKKVRGFLIDAGTEDMLVNAVWPELPGTQWNNSAKSINWYNIHRAMWTTNCYLWRELNDQAFGFSNGRRMAIICWTTLQRCYDHGYEIGGRAWKDIRDRIVYNFADDNGGGAYNFGTSRLIHLNGSSAYKKEGYSGSMIEWGYVKDTRVLMGQQLAAAIGPRAVQSVKPAWFDIPIWSSGTPGTAAINPTTGDLEISWEDLKQVGGWDKTGYQVQWWRSDGSLAADEFVKDNFYTMSSAKAQQLFGQATPSTITMSMCCKDNRTGALGPRVAKVFSGIKWNLPVQSVSWKQIGDNKLLVTPACQFNATLNVDPAVAANSAKASDFSVSNTAMADVRKIDTLNARITCKNTYGTFQIINNFTDVDSKVVRTASQTMQLGTLAYSALITEQSPTLQGGGVGKLITTPVWKPNEWVVFDLTVDFSSDNNWTWVRNCLSQLMGGQNSISDSHDSTDPSVFQVGKTHPETGAPLPDRKYALVCISYGKADVTFSGEHTYNGTYNFSKKYSLKAGNIVDEVGALYNPGNGIGIVGGKLQMQEPSITPSNVSGIRKTWESSNANIATVDATTGLVTFKATGNVTIKFVVTDDAGRKTSSTSFTVKQMTPQWRMWIGTATNGAYPNPAGTSGMKTFSTSKPMEYGSGPKVGQMVYFGAYIPEIIGLPRSQLQLLFGAGVDDLATFGYSDNIEAARSSGWVGFRMESGKEGRILGTASIGVMFPGDQQYRLGAYATFSR